METMNRQHAVIAMAKIGRLVKQLRYWQGKDAKQGINELFHSAWKSFMYEQHAEKFLKKFR